MSTTAQDDQYIVVSVLRDRHITSTEMKNNLQQIGMNVSNCIIRIGGRKSLSETSVSASFKIPAREARLNFAMEYQNWDVHDWNRVLFTDECRFCFRAPDDESLFKGICSMYYKIERKF